MNTNTHLTPYACFQLEECSDKLINLLHHLLIRQGWIDPHTPDRALRELFSGKHSPCEIRWTGHAGVGAMRYLIRRMIELRLVARPRGYGIDYILEHHLTDSHGDFIRNIRCCYLGVRNRQIVEEWLNILTSPLYG